MRRAATLVKHDGSAEKNLPGDVAAAQTLVQLRQGYCN